MRMPSFTIRGKITVTMASLLVVILLLGGIAVQRFRVLDETVNSITGNYMPAIGYLDEMNSADLSLRIAVVQLVSIGGDPALREQLLRAVEERRARRAKAEALYAPAVVTPAEADIYRSYKEIRSRADALTDKALVLVRDDRLDAALAGYLAELRPVAKMAEEALARNIAFNVGEAKRLATVAAADYASGRNAVIVVLAVAVLLAVAAGGLLVRSVATPVVAMTAAMRRLAAGELSTDIPALDRRDEIGSMAEAMLVFRANAQSAQDLQGAADKVQAVKDYRQAALDRHTQDFGAAASGVMAGLMESAETMACNASAMAREALDTQGTATRTAAGAIASSQSLNTVAAAAEEMAASANEIGHYVGSASHAVAQAVDRAAQTDAKVGGMAKAAERVGNIVHLIAEIASQTNLLALNASIEAARAGEAGRGFAVVAGEVKALAAQTARATQEIGKEIAAIRTATEEAVSAVRAVGNAIGEVNTVTTSIAAAIEQQGAATREIATSVQGVTASTSDACNAMQDVSRMSARAGTASQTVLDTAGQVGRIAGVLRSELDQFTRAIALSDEANRRRYERIAGNSTFAEIRGPGLPPTQAAIVDISLGGVALRCTWRAAPGTEISVVLPGSREAVPARVVRNAEDALPLTFRQSLEVLAVVDAAMTHIARRYAEAA